MPELPSVCVFCGSNPGGRADYLDAAVTLGRTLAQRGITLVYGGARAGLMGAVADAALAAGGRVVGVIPQSLIDREIGHVGLTELHVVHSMHERKQQMADRASGFIALPGGFGTLEEFCEIVTWAQLGIHAKPCALLNVANYYDGLLSFLDHAVDEQFIKPQYRALAMSDSDPVRLLDRMARYEPPKLTQWVSRDET
jgi:uncharacterized protein (TIGR00730 family)